MGGKFGIKIGAGRLEASALAEIESVLRGGGRIGVACSGGADSVCALMLVARIFESAKNRICVLHFNHRERPAADSDAEFVGRLAKRLGAEFVCGAADCPPERITEAGLRAMRLGFFAAESARLGLGAIVQGHNSGDVAETLVMRLMRGAGLAGMSAPRAVSHYKGAEFVRPLLLLSKSEIREILRRNKIEWREDETNASPDFLRNRLRSEIVPALDSLCSGGFAESALRTRAQLCEDSDFIENIFSRALVSANPELELAGADSDLRLLRLPEEYRAEPAFLRRAAMKLLSLNLLAGRVRSGCVDAFVAAAAGGFARADVSDKFDMYFDGKSVRLEPKADAREWEVVLKSGKNRLPDGRVLRVEKISLTQARFESIKNGDNDDSRRAYIDLSATGGLCGGALVARTRRDGDEYPPLGARSPKRLKEIFNAKKVPVWKRAAAVVVCNLKGEILWSPALPPSELYKVGKSRSVIELTCENF